MSLALSPVLDVKGATAVAATPAKLVVGFGSGAVHVYARDDQVLERSFSAGKARVDALQWIPNTELVAAVCASRCAVYNLATRRLEVAVDTRSARLMRAHALANGGRLAVASTYKLRLLDFAEHGGLVRETLLAAPEKHRLAALEAWRASFYVVFGARPKLFRVEPAGFRPVALLHPHIGTPRLFVTAAAGNVLLVAGAHAAQLLELAENEAPRVVAVLENAALHAAAAIDAASTQIPLLCAAADNNKLVLVNPLTGTALAQTPTHARPAASHPATLALGDTVYAIDCDVSIDFITALGESDLREAATLALSLGPQHTADRRIRGLQQQYAMHVFEQDADDDRIAKAMRLFTAIEEQEQTHAPTNHRFVIGRVIEPFLDGLSDAPEPPAAAQAPSVFSARTAPKRRHVLDPIVAYLVYARRHLRLAHAREDKEDARHNDAADKEAADVDVNGSAEGSADLVGVDTALFRCYMLMHSPLVAPLLRSPNHCDPHVVKDMLLAAGKWRELVWFLRSKRDPDQHRQALDLLVEHNEPAQSIIAYLEQAHTDPEIVFKYAEPLLKADPALAHRLFFEESVYNSWDVYTYLQNIDPTTAASYALFRVRHADDERPELHDEAARLLAHTEPDLLAFLGKSSHYRPQVLVDDPEIPPRARAFLHSKMHHYTAAIDLYLDPLHDFDAARNEAETHACATYLFDRLIDSDLLAPFLNSAATNTDLTFMHALQRLSSDLSVKELAPFLEKFTAATETKLRRSELTEALSRVALTDYSLQLMDRRKARYVVTPTTACAVCRKRLGQAVMGIRAGEMVHYGCLER